MILTFTVTMILVQLHDERYTREGMMIPYKGSCIDKENKVMGFNKVNKECRPGTHIRAISALAGKTVTVLKT